MRSLLTHRVPMGRKCPLSQFDSGLSTDSDLFRQAYFLSLYNIFAFSAENSLGWGRLEISNTFPYYVRSKPKKSAVSSVAHLLDILCSSSSSVYIRVIGSARSPVLPEFRSFHENSRKFTQNPPTQFDTSK